MECYQQVVGESAEDGIKMEMGSSQQHTVCLVVGYNTGFHVAGASTVQTTVHHFGFEGLCNTPHILSSCWYNINMSIEDQSFAC